MRNIIWFVVSNLQNVLPTYFLKHGIYAGVVFHNLKLHPEKWWCNEFSKIDWILLWVLSKNRVQYSKMYFEMHPTQSEDFEIVI
jgi:hypothetical protein